MAWNFKLHAFSEWPRKSSGWEHEQNPCCSDNAPSRHACHCHSHFLLVLERETPTTNMNLVWKGPASTRRQHHILFTSISKWTDSLILAHICVLLHLVFFVRSQECFAVGSCSSRESLPTPTISFSRNYMDRWKLGNGSFLPLPVFVPSGNSVLSEKTKVNCPLLQKGPDLSYCLNCRWATGSMFMCQWKRLAVISNLDDRRVYGCYSHRFVKINLHWPFVHCGSVPNCIRTHTENVASFFNTNVMPVGYCFLWPQQNSGFFFFSMSVSFSFVLFRALSFFRSKLAFCSRWSFPVHLSFGLLSLSRWKDSRIWIWAKSKLGSACAVCREKPDSVTPTRGETKQTKPSIYLHAVCTHSVLSSLVPCG